jgi:glucokinase
MLLEVTVRLGVIRMPSFAVGVDIGGTKVAVGIVDCHGRVKREQTLATDRAVPAVTMVERIGSAILQLIDEAGMERGQIAGIGIGAPGPLDAKNGVLTCPPNLPGWANVPLAEMVKRKCSLPVFLENDANAAALGEKWMGAARDTGNFIYLTISTGIGAGLFLDGKLVSGFRGNAGDVGHIVIDPAYGTCSCGQQGCLEWIASGTAIARQASQLMGRKLTAEEAIRLYRENHPVIKPLIEQIFTKIGVGCVSLINAFDPEMIVIGGGVSQAGKPLFTAVREYVSRYALNPAGRQTAIVPAQLRQHSGVIGAAALVFHPSR